MRVQHINHVLNPGKCFIFTDFVQCTYFELQQGNGVTATPLCEVLIEYTSLLISLGQSAFSLIKAWAL